MFPNRTDLATAENADGPRKTGRLVAALRRRAAAIRADEATPSLRSKRRGDRAVPTAPLWWSAEDLADEHWQA